MEYRMITLNELLGYVTGSNKRYVKPFLPPTENLAHVALQVGIISQVELSTDGTRTPTGNIKVVFYNSGDLLTVTLPAGRFAPVEPIQVHKAHAKNLDWCLLSTEELLNQAAKASDKAHAARLKQDQAQKAAFEEIRRQADLDLLQADTYIRNLKRKPPAPSETPPEADTT